MDHAAASDDIVYAGFWRRLGAYVIDNFILTVAFYVAVILVGLIVYGAGIAKPETRDAGQWFIISLLPLYYVGAALYYGLQESSRHQATVGKRALGIKVTDAHGRRLTRGRAFGRWFAAALSYLTVYIGFIMAAFTGRKQALHDMVAETLVVDRWAYTEFPERQQRHVGALAVILSLVLLVVPIIAILAAIAIPAYQEYMLRAQTAEAMAAAAPVKALVARAWGEHHACPDNGEAGIAPAKLMPAATWPASRSARCTTAGPAASKSPSPRPRSRWMASASGWSSTAPGVRGPAARKSTANTCRRTAGTESLPQAGLTRRPGPAPLERA